jgi:hypothetical protein
LQTFSGQIEKTAGQPGSICYNAPINNKGLVQYSIFSHLVLRPTAQYQEQASDPAKFRQSFLSVVNSQEPGKGSLNSCSVFLIA